MELAAASIFNSSSLIFHSILGQLHPRHHGAVYFIRPVGQAQGAGHGEDGREGHVVRNASATVNLNGLVYHTLKHVRRHYLMAEISFIAAFTPCVSIFQAV